MQSTPQQSAIAHARLDGITKVSAYAGTGKTTALTALSVQQATSQKRGLYLAFNKAAEMDAKKRFPAKFVTTKTVHALAFARFGGRYVHKLRTMKTVEVIKLMGLSWDWRFAKMVLDTVIAWCASDMTVFPVTAMSIDGKPIDTPVRLAYAAQIAHQLWNRMVDVADEVPMPHDGYLKLFQLSQPSLAVDYLMLDEGQDTNPVTWDIVKRQACPVVIVGDKYQSIYQFRGAFNAMDLTKADQEFPLTQSFRFGPGVARIANTLLWGFYSETTPLEGLGPATKVARIDAYTRHAVIARTNATVFAYAVTGLRAGKRLGFVGGVASYGFEKIVDTWHLANGQNELVRDPFLRDFPSFNDLAIYAENANDFEAKRMVEVVKSYGAEIETIVPAIHAAAAPSLDGADMVLTTAHKSKGLTLPAVKLADDFPGLIGIDGIPLPPELLNRQEVNLLYVAMTRASHHLQVNSTTLEYLHCMGIDGAQYNLGVEECAVPSNIQLSNQAPDITTTAHLDQSSLPTLIQPAAVAKPLQSELFN